MRVKKRIGQQINSSAIFGKPYTAYIRKPLPANPPLDMAGLYPLLDQANTAIGRLETMHCFLDGNGSLSQN